MSKRAKLAIGAVGFLLVILLGTFLFLRHLVTKSFPQTEGELVVAVLQSPVHIFRDEYGVPHIMAENEHDAIAAMGYVHAQDRMWQMDIMRRAGEGRLSEVLGRGALSYDKQLRTVGFRRIAERLAESLHPESRVFLEAYGEGVNTYIETHRGKFPVEFDMLNYEPERWTALHSLMIGRLMAWELCMGWWEELTLGELMERFSLDKASQIFPPYPKETPRPISWPSGPRKIALNVREFLSTGRALREFLDFQGYGAGSNAWVISGTKTVSGYPMLANDPHLSLPSPSKWYLLHLKGGELNVVGVSIPGTPFVILGRNENVAWSFTNLMADDVDFYIEKVDSLHPGRYFSQGKWLKMDTVAEEVRISDSAAVPLNITMTHHGPIINAVHSSWFYQDSANVVSRPPVSMRWTGFEVTDEVYALSLLNRARSWKDVRKALEHLEVPGQNVLFADREGNIGYQAAVRLPLRGKQSSTLPMPGWDDRFEWMGFVPFSQLPFAVNPPNGYFASANNKPVDDSYSYFISDLWEPPSRIVRLVELLGTGGPFSVQDVQRMQLDYVSPHARETAPYLLHAFESQNVQDSSLQTALSYFRNWDFNLRKEDVTSTIFNAFYERLLWNTFEDEMGRDLYHDYVYLANVPIRVISELLKFEWSPWFDDVTTKDVESRDDIIRKSLVDALEELKAALGDELKVWSWGDIHRVTFKHILGVKRPLDKIFNVGPFPVGGAGTTVNSGQYNFTSPFQMTIGPSFRHITDLSDTRSSLMVIVPGQSGQPLHPHYDDFVPLWLNGLYHRILLDEGSIKEQESWTHLVLRPKT